VVDFGPIFEALRWNGFFDLEIFSDAELDGSLWREDPRELAARGVQQLRRVVSTASA
jgi:sugar phosphate isomerase/epimerase